MATTAGKQLGKNHGYGKLSIMIKIKQLKHLVTILKELLLMRLLVSAVTGIKGALQRFYTSTSVHSCWGILLHCLKPFVGPEAPV